MGKIRSFIDFEYTDVDGNTVRNDAFASRWFTGINMFIDDKYISARKMNRRICSCGNVDDSALDEPCPVCGNTDFQRIKLSSGRWYRGSEQRVYEKATHLVDNGLVSYYIDAQWNCSRNCFTLKETKYEVLKFENGFYSAVMSYVDREETEKLFMKYVSTRKEWEPALNLMATYPVETIAALEKNGRNCTPMQVCISFYNLAYAIPQITAVSPDLFYAIYSKFVTSSNRAYSSIQDFYKQVKAPMCLSEIYGIAGLPNGDLLMLDAIDARVVNAVSYALVHRHVTYHELESMFHSKDVDEINSYGVEFAEFFRKNIIKYSSRTLEAYRYINSEYNASGIKDANIKKFARYAEKKGIKKDKVIKFADLMYEGDAIDALKALL